MAINFNPGVTAGSANAVDPQTSPSAASDSSRRTSLQLSAPDDTTSLVSSSDAVANLTQASLDSAAARAQRVESLKQAVSANQYPIDPQQIAEALTKSQF
jgi:flagellar biosynthesis anti-sigma factor FlgM